MRIRLRQKKNKKNASPVPPAIFDAEFYRIRYPDTHHQDPWEHYCSFGFRDNRDPNPIFNTAHYRELYLQGKDNVNPLLHYLIGDDPFANTHPLFDASFYGSQLDELPGDMSLLEHFIRFNNENRLSPSPFFDSAAYLDTYEDIDRARMNPLYHFLRHGIEERRISFVDLNHVNSVRFRDPNELESLRRYLDPELEFMVHLLQIDREAPTIVCVSHEASLTGAPLIILRIAETLHRDYGFNIVNILCNEGDLTSRFAAIGPTFSLEGTAPYRHAHNFKSFMSFFVRSMGIVNVVGALVNSAESRHVLSRLSSLNVPIHMLIHENARCYCEFEEKPFGDIGKHCDRAIFPSDYVYDAALEESGVTEEQSEIIPQGLLRDEMLEPGDPERAREIRSEFGIPEDGVLVLGCGTGDGRKGLDLFIATAISAIRRDSSDKIYFGWLGNLDVTTNVSGSFWAKMDVETAELENRIIFFGPQTQIKDFFDASDIFYLPSRIDPFPCVVNEAMARSKPIVLFDRGSGCVDLISSEGGAIIPFGDVCAACDELLQLAADQDRRMAAGKRNRQYVEQHMNFDDYVAKLLDGLVEDMRQPRYELIKNEPLETLIDLHRTTDDNAKKRVFFLAPSWSVSGVNTFAENLGRELNNRGFEASILFTSADSKSLSTDLLPEIPYQFLLSGWVDTGKKNQRLVEFLSAMAPAVVIPNCDYSSSPIAANLPDNVRTVGVLHSDDSEHYLHGYRMGHYWDKIVPVSQTIRSQLLELNPVFESKTQVIRCGIQPPPGIVNSLNHTTAADEIRIVYTGRIEQYQKRIFDFVDLMSELDRRKVPYTMTFIGSGPDEVEFHKRARKHINNGNARMLGRLKMPEIYQELSEHHVFCLLSDFEGLPISLLEGLACGCVPVVTQIKSGIEEILEHQHNSLKSPLRDIQAMAENLERLYLDGALRCSLAEEAKKTLDAHQLTTSRMADNYEALFNDIFADIQHGGRSPIELPLSCPRVGSLLEAA